jgi:hypothetical protein
MTRIHLGLIPKSKEDLSDGPHQRGVVPARKIDSPDGARKQRVTDEELFPRRASLPDLKADTTGTVARCVMHPNLMGPERHELMSIVVETVDGWRGFYRQSEELTKRDGVLV